MALGDRTVSVHSDGEERPAEPFEGETWRDPATGISYRWNGTEWTEEGKDIRDGLAALDDWAHQAVQALESRAFGLEGRATALEERVLAVETAIATVGARLDALEGWLMRLEVGSPELGTPTLTINP